MTMFLRPFKRLRNVLRIKSTVVPQMPRNHVRLLCVFSAPCSHHDRVKKHRPFALAVHPAPCFQAYSQPLFA